MKVFLLVVLIIMLFYRMNQTPRNLSERIWEREIPSKIEEIKLKKEEITDELWNIVKLTTTIVASLLSIACIFVYFLVSVELNSKYIFALSILKSGTILYDLKRICFSKEPFSLNVEGYKFHRFQSMFRVLLDYFYYPIAIVMLLM